MNNFEYHNPVKIIFGKEQLHKLCELIPHSAKVMLTYGGGSIKKTGLYDKLKKILSSYQVIEFGAITPNPQYDQMMEAIELAKDNDITFILAVGGGSVIDASKFIAAGIYQDSDPWKIVAEREPIKQVIPFGCVLTLPATGSEMNNFSVISRGEQKIGFGGDPRLFAQFSFLDPELTYGLPKKQLGNGIVDAFVHVTEQYLTKDINTPIQDRFSEGILKTLIEEAPRVMELEKDFDSRANFMWAATSALNGLIASGVIHDWATHMVGHQLTALYNIDHARSLALILPSLLRVQKETKKQKLLMFSKNVWNIVEEDIEKSIEIAINKTEDFFNSVGVPTKLTAYNLGASDIEKIIESMEKMLQTGLGENRDIDSQKLRKILSMAL